MKKIPGRKFRARSGSRFCRRVKTIRQNFFGMQKYVWKILKFKNGIKLRNIFGLLNC